MTPIARTLFKTGARRQWPEAVKRLFGKATSGHFFDCSPLDRLIWDLHKDKSAINHIVQNALIPDYDTWLEFTILLDEEIHDVDDFKGFAVLRSVEESLRHFDLALFGFGNYPVSKRKFLPIFCGRVNLDEIEHTDFGEFSITFDDDRMASDFFPIKEAITRRGVDLDSAEIKTTLSYFLLCLGLMSQPKLVRRAERRGLQINRDAPWYPAGDFPLKAWSEVYLRMDDIPREKGESPQAYQKRCLHFVRGHYRRLASGELTTVRPHWRGDGSRGIKQQYYTAGEGPRNG